MSTVASAQANGGTRGVAVDGAAAYVYEDELPSTSAMLGQLLKESEIQQLFESYYSLIHIPVAVIDLHANVLCSSRWQRICTQFHRVHPMTCARCLASDWDIAARLQDGLAYAVRDCENGLTDCAAPLLLEGKHVANVFIGQFLTHELDEERFRRQAQEFGFPVEDYLAAARELPFVDETRIQAILELLARMTRVVTKLGAERKRAIDAQARSELILNTIPQGVFWKDRDGRYVGCNSAFAAAAGLSAPEDVVGKTDFDLPWPREDAESYRARDQEVLTRNRPLSQVTESLRVADGTVHTIETTKVPLLDATSTTCGVLGIYQDISADVAAREALRASEEKFRRAFMTGLDAIYIATRDDGRVLDCNDRFLSLFGYGREEVLGRTSLELDLYVDPTDRARMLGELKATGFVRDRVLRFRKKGGEVGLLSMSVSPLDMGDRPHILGVLRDITEQKRAEAELDQHRRHLQELVDERTAELAAARTAADEANRAKSVFLANMSHEIRTPLNAVLGFAQLLLSDPAATPEQRDHFRTITRAGDHLLSLIDGILQLAKVESGRVPLVEATFDLWGVLDDLERLFAARAREKRIALALQRAHGVPRYVRADEGKLRQVLANLLSNAVKFTARGGVEIRVAATTTARPRLEFEVEDSGPGIAQDEQDRLFRKFEQTESGRSSGHGTGLGLAISRELVGIMRGEISVTSRPGVGSVFRFAIPFAPGIDAEVAPRAEVRRPARLAPDQPPCRVLVVDDTDHNRALLTAVLGRVGLETRAAGGGAEAIREFQAWRPHAVLMDLRMPGVDGAEAIRRIRGAPGGADVRIVCVSASAFDEDRTVARAVGADDFLTKPVRDAALFEKLRVLLGLRYEYAADSAEPSGAPAAETDLAGIPAALRERLRHATVTADLDRMLALTDELGGRDGAAAAALRALATRFEYERILALLDGGTRP